MRTGDIPDSMIPVADPDAVVRQYSGLVAKISEKYKNALSHTALIDEMDLQQAGLIAVAEAQKKYNPNNGCTFVTFVYNAVQFAMLNMLRTGFEKVETVSFSAPVPGTEDITIEETIPDPAPTAEERTVAQDGQQEIVDTVRGAVDRLKSAKHREVISRIWLDGQDKQTAAEEMGISLASLRNLDLKARYKLRRDRKLRTLAFPLYHVGVDSFHRTSLSAVELCVLWREQRFDEVFGSGSFAGTRDRDEE